MEGKLKAAAMDSVGERTEFTPAIINKIFPDSFIPENAKVTAVQFGDKVATCVEELPAGYLHLPTKPIKQNLTTTRNDIFKLYCEDKNAGDWHRPQENYEAGYRKGFKDGQPIKQEPQLTDWFNGAKFVPAHVGDYETKKYSRIFKCFAKQHWDGKKWSAGWFNEIAMHIAKRMTPVSQSPTWRGIKK